MKIIKKDISQNSIIIENVWKSDLVHTIFIGGLLTDVISVIPIPPIIEVNNLELNPPFSCELKDYKKDGFVEIGYYPDKGSLFHKSKYFYPKQIKISNIKGFEFVFIKTDSEANKYGLRAFLKQGILYYPEGNKTRNGILTEFNKSKTNLIS